MSDTVIRVENLGKKYIIGHQQQERYTALRDVITNKVKSIDSLLNPPAKNENPAFEEFWALKDVSFDIKQGDRVGIIGRNGAGKSTLLKILSRITEPTSGKISFKGRVASLLEVGTGFHPELTGRENVYLNGAILGMDRFEIKKKFDEIVAFAEVEKFLDTPVKRYSSGMYVRLAFAVAAHLEPEILIVDEVLAVGDSAFQKKCLGKMEDVAEKEGRTVLFVSHNMSAIQMLCNEIIYLKSGQIRSSGQVEEIIKIYFNEYKYESDQSSRYPVKVGNSLQILQFQINPNPLKSGESIEFMLEFSCNQTILIKELAILIYSVLGLRVAIIDLRNEELSYTVDEINNLKVYGKIKELLLVEGDYTLGIYLSCDGFSGNILELVNLVVDSKQKKSTIIPYPAASRGLIELELTELILK